MQLLFFFWTKILLRYKEVTGLRNAANFPWKNKRTDLEFIFKTNKLYDPRIGIDYNDNVQNMLIIENKSVYWSEYYTLILKHSITL